MGGSPRPEPVWVLVALLVKELKRIAGWGCGRPGAPRRLARQPRLSELAQVQSLAPDDAGSAIIEYLWDSIKTFDGPREYLGREYDAHTLRRAFCLELGLEQGHLTAPRRLERTTKALRLTCNYDNWRSNHLYQRGLLTLLARHMVERQVSQPDEAV